MMCISFVIQAYMFKWKFIGDVLHVSLHCLNTYVYHVKSD